MIVWLDHKIFGNGKGLGSPYWDDAFYWLNEEMYHYSFGYGAQLTSFQWRMPRPGETRTLCCRKFRVFSASRRWGRVRVKWAMTRMSHDFTVAAGEIELLHKDLMACEGRNCKGSEG